MAGICEVNLILNMSIHDLYFVKKIASCLSRFLPIQVKQSDDSILQEYYKILERACCDIESNHLVRFSIRLQ